MGYSRRSVVVTLALLSGCSGRSTDVLHAPKQNSQLKKTGKWPFVRHDIKNTAYLPDGVSLSDPELCWSTSFESRETRYESPPVATESHLLVSNYGEKFVEAVNPRDGSHQWSSKMSGRPQHAPCIVGDTGVIPAGVNLLTIGLDKGDVLHSTELSGIAGPPIVDQDTVFVGTSDGNPKAQAVDFLSGDIIWEQSTSLITTPPAVTGSIVVYVDWDGTVYAFDASSGEMRWNFQTEGEFIRSAPLIESGSAYVCAGANRAEGWVYAFDVETGEKRWQRRVPDASISASPAADSSKLYVVDDRSRVYAFDLTTGERQWRTDGRENAVPRQTVDQSPVVTDSRLYYVTGSRSIVAVSTATGNRSWRRETELELQTSPILMPGGAILTGERGITCLCD